MSIPYPSTKVQTVKPYKDEPRYVRIDNVITCMKDDLIYILSNPNSDEFASEYLKDRIKMWEGMIKLYEKQDKDGN